MKLVFWEKNRVSEERLNLTSRDIRHLHTTEAIHYSHQGQKCRGWWRMRAENRGGGGRGIAKRVNRAIIGIWLQPRRAI